MAPRALNISDLTLQLEATAAQLRVLSLLPESQCDGCINKTIEEIKAQVSGIDARLKKLCSQTQSLRSKTENRLLALEAAMYNNERRMLNKYIMSAYDSLEPLHNDYNKAIEGFPDTANGFRDLNEAECERITQDLGWNVNEGDSLRTKQDFLLKLI